MRFGEHVRVDPNVQLKSAKVRIEIANRSAKPKAGGGYFDSRSVRVLRLGHNPLSFKCRGNWRSCSFARLLTTAALGEFSRSV